MGGRRRRHAPLVPDLGPVVAPPKADLDSLAAPHVHGRLRARIAHWDLASGGVTKWGQGNLANYTAYIDFLAKWKVVPVAVPVTDVVTNDLVADMNDFDPAKIEAAAKAWKP